MELNTLLVPMDFSETSLEAYQQALQMASGEDCAVILLHVIDSTLVDFAVQHELITADEMVSRMRNQAERRFEDLAASRSSDVDVQTVICEGLPFLEVIRKAEEFQVDAVVMGKFGIRGKVEKLLFGTTAERVIRWVTKPVIVIPHGTP